VKKLIEIKLSIKQNGQQFNTFSAEI